MSAKAIAANIFLIFIFALISPPERSPFFNSVIAGFVAGTSWTIRTFYRNVEQKVPCPLPKSAGLWWVTVVYDLQERAQVQWSSLSMLKHLDDHSNNHYQVFQMFRCNHTLDSKQQLEGNKQDEMVMHVMMEVFECFHPSCWIFPSSPTAPTLMPDARATDLGDHDGLAWNIATWALKWRTNIFLERRWGHWYSNFSRHKAGDDDISF